MTDDRASSTSEDGGHLASVWSEQGVSNRVHAPVDAMQAANLKPVFDGGPAKPGSDQLAARHESVLALRQAGDHAVGGGRRGHPG
jgi:hypothetical protein